MTEINQHSVFNSIHEALEPGTSLIDGRTEQDWLRFLTDFAALINFYDQDNTIQGNWEPFLLKDPVFLMAAISGTGFSKLYSLYLRICHKLEQTLLPLNDKRDLPGSFNELFDHLGRIFIKMRLWTYYLQRSAEEYPFKTDTLLQVRVTIAGYLQAIILLRAELFSAGLITGIRPFDPVFSREFEGYENRIWKEHEFQRPYHQVLELVYPLQANTMAAIFKALTGAAEVLFNFLRLTITEASAEFIRLTKLKSSYPDTTLLRAFVHLLRVHQAQLNGIGEKHLNFYYKEILKQVERPGLADRAFVFAGLAKKDAIVKLPAGTLFDGGTDAENAPVVFENTEVVVLNPAIIPMAYTLSRAPGSDELSSLQLQTIPDPGVVQKDADGKTLFWDTLGSREASAATQQPLGIAFASPMLLLREGTRQISISLGYTGEADLTMMQQASCYLSTLDAWFPVTAAVQLTDTSSSPMIIFDMELEATDPAIESFLVNPDGIVSSWPMFKLVFNWITVRTVPPPVIHTLQIDVTVSGIETLQLYNDYGALSTKVAYPPFGPSPPAGSSFIIGSNEIFSKPLSTLTVQLNWSLLPPDFSAYYQAYNLYLNNRLRISKTPETSWWEKIFGVKSKPAPVEEEVDSPYNNSCFTVDFQLLETQSWKPVAFNAVTETSSDTTVPADLSLFFIAEDGTPAALSTYSSSAAELLTCDPFLQNEPLKFTEVSTSGFMMMELSGPEYGFGSGIYPSVVSAVTLNNARILYGNEDVPFVDPAQLPFTPKLKSFSADYTASVQYLLDQDNPAADVYPLQCFLYTPFANYPVYDNLDQPPVQEYTIGGSPAEDNPGMPLYASYNYDGFLYLSLEGLLPASSLNLYFEMTRRHLPGTSAEVKTGYYYLSTSGWKPLIVLSDGTHNLRCSGIVSVNIPDDITCVSDIMPKESYWIAVAANDVSAVAGTVLLSTNGIEVQRSGKDFLSAIVFCFLAAYAITKTKTPFPLISLLQQPFPSFGGRPAEDFKAMSRRVSHRLKTKDRAVVSSDYFRLIVLEFSYIYSAVSVYCLIEKQTTVYVVKRYDSPSEPHAFLPMASSIQEEQIQLFLQQRTSAFAMIRVANPDFISVSVCVSISIEVGYEFSAVQLQVSQALNIYLSPWIKDQGPQTEIYQEITSVQVSAFIKTINGVIAVDDIYFKTWTCVETQKNAVPQQTIMPLPKSALLVSGMVHQIILSPSAS